MPHVYTARILWEGEPGTVRNGRYCRAHRWLFDGGVAVDASASPLHVPLPFSRADAVDPEEAFVASLSSCHMLFALSFAARDGWVIERYEDEASGEMGVDDTGRESLTSVTLRPSITVAGEHRPGRAEIDDLHHRAHAACYLANSVRTEIRIEPRDPSETA